MRSQIKTLQKRTKRADGIVAKTLESFKTGNVDRSQLVQIRRVHQTKRAAKSVWPGTGTEDRKEPEGPTAGSQRRNICMQIAEVIRRTGIGLERGLRWKLGVAPETKDSAELSALSGNSANAELAAGERVKVVRIRFYLQKYLDDGLVGKEPVCAGDAKRLPLTKGTWAFVFTDGRVYVGEGA